MKTIIYARVATELQNDVSNSLPTQIERMKNYCDRKSFDVVKVISSDESRHKKGQNALDELLKHVVTISKNEKIAVCFDKVDCLSRSIFDRHVSELYEMALADKIELHFASDEQFINNQMSAVEKFQFGISLGLAKYYSDGISNSVKRAFEQKRRNGEWIGKAPFGYLNARNKDGKAILIIDKEKALIAKRCIELAKQNITARQAVAILKSEFPEFSFIPENKNSPKLNLTRTYLYIMNNISFYSGYVHYQTEEIKHSYPLL